MEKLKVQIGRSSQCDYTIENPEIHGTVSGKHATLSETDQPDIFLFEDHSTNGSYINGQLIHNSSCLVKVADNVTLGKTYVLHLDDIIKRYFSSYKTTKKVPQYQQKTDLQLDPAATRLTPITHKDRISSNNATCLLPQDVVKEEPSVVKVEKIVEKIPTWYWGLYIASITIAFILGFCINYYC